MPVILLHAPDPTVNRINKNIFLIGLIYVQVVCGEGQDGSQKK